MLLKANRILSSFIFYFLIVGILSSCERVRPTYQEKILPKSLLSITVTLNKSLGFYQEFIEPILDKSCTKGCHSNPIEINLTIWPYDIKGSYIEEVVISQFGVSYTFDQAKEMVVNELIKSMETGYMPPDSSDIEPVPPAEIAKFKSWVEKGIPGPADSDPFIGQLKIDGLSASKVICSSSFPVEKKVTKVILDEDSCKDGQEFVYSILDKDSKIISSKKYPATEFWSLKTLDIEVNP